MPNISSDYAKNKAMKSKKARRFINDRLSIGSLTFIAADVEYCVTCAEQEAEERIRRELTRWHDPKKEPPKNNVCVLLKVVDQLDNETIYLGSREGIEYMTDGGLVFGTDFDNESMPDMNVKVIGWREIL